ncbi:MAG: YcxB family protein [Spirochaetota bacterium]|nr:YcxB family protein [Spirochaetota bacterium]
MTLKYSLTDDDIIEFQLYHVKKSPSMQASIRFWSLLIPVILMITVVVLDQIMDNLSKVYLVFGFALSIVLAAGYRFIYYHTIKRYTRKMLKEGENKGLIGEQIIKVQDQSLSISEAKGKIKYDEPFINRIAENSNYFFIYISSVSAYIIPKTVFESEEEKMSFVTKIKPFVCEAG